MEIYLHQQTVMGQAKLLQSQSGVNHKNVCHEEKFYFFLNKGGTDSVSCSLTSWTCSLQVVHSAPGSSSSCWIQRSRPCWTGSILSVFIEGCCWASMETWPLRTECSSCQRMEFGPRSWHITARAQQSLSWVIFCLSLSNSAPQITHFICLHWKET